MLPYIATLAYIYSCSEAMLRFILISVALLLLQALDWHWQSEKGYGQIYRAMTCVRLYSLTFSYKN